MTKNTTPTTRLVKSKNTNTTTYLLLILTTVLTLFLIQQYQQNRELERALELLNSSFETERKHYQHQQDSIQAIVVQQEKQQESLKEKITVLEQAKTATNKKYHEKANIILRIRAVNNLRNEVTRHYRH